MPYFHSSDAEVYYEVLGTGQPLVFSHGLGGSLEKVKEFVEDLPGIQAIVYDNRSHGQTRIRAGCALNFGSMAADMAALLDHLSLGSVFVGGVSMGAGIALAFALQNGPRARALILSRPAWLDKPHPENLECTAVLADLIDQHGIEGAGGAFRQTDCFRRVQSLSPAAAESLCGGLDGADPQALTAAYRAVPASAPVSSMDRLSELRVPALVIGTQGDPIHPFFIAEEWARRIPASRLAELPSRYEDPAGHVQQFRRAVGEFLQTVQ